MRRIPTLLVTTLFLAALAACGGKEEPAAEAGPDLIAGALKKAAAEEKNVLVEYYDETCPFCTQMDEEVYTDDFVQELLGHVVYLRLDRGKTGKPFEDRWGEMRTPSFVVLTPDGKQIGETKTGFIDVDGMTTFVDWAAMAEGEMPGIATGGS